MNLPFSRLARAGTLLLALLGLAAAHAAESPPAPYFSVHLTTATGRAQALELLKKLGNEPSARAEKRQSGWHVRFGAWGERAEAERALARHSKKFADARVIQVENPVEWLLASGETASPPGRGKALVEKPAATAAASAAVDEAAFRAAAQRLDTETRRWLDATPARKDGYVYGMDVAPLLLYAANRKDAALYAQLREAALPLIVGGDDESTRGFVLWRYRVGADPEVSGATEALWLGRALWSGHRNLSSAEDRALALTVLDGYARHAAGASGNFIVHKYYAFGTGTFAGLSLLPNYGPDFVGELEPQGSARVKGVAKRSYQLLQRAITPSRLLTPVAQPDLDAILPGIGISLYAPNGMVSLEDSCAAAEGALRGMPQLARSVLDFTGGAGRLDANGRLHAYYHRQDGRPVGTAALSSTGYACLARLAAATKDTRRSAALKAALLADMTYLTDSAPTNASPLYSAGPLLLAADALGAL